VTSSPSSTAVTLEHDEGRVFVEELEPGRRRIAVELFDPLSFAPYSFAETGYSLELIEKILAFRGPAMLCYSIVRAEDPSHLLEPLRQYILGYVDESEFEGRRLLDYGCGSGSSAVALASLFPRTEIVGVDLVQGNVAVARARAQHHNVVNATFFTAPSATEVPAEIGTFDFILLSAVYEHLLPDERRILMPRIWKTLRLGGVLLLNQLPHRYYPLEYHTTGLPLLNYLPDSLAFWVAKRFSKRVKANCSWNELLRAGVRGGTQREILNRIRDAGEGVPQLLEPHRHGFTDSVDIWYSLSMARRPLRVKWAMRVMFKAIGRITGTKFVPDLDLAIKKT
jgi:ubiquinone/menaquinone biosynthesis C-methylase UbiE